MKSATLKRLGLGAIVALGVAVASLTAIPADGVGAQVIQTCNDTVSSPCWLK